MKPSSPFIHLFTRLSCGALALSLSLSAIAQTTSPQLVPQMTRAEQTHCVALSPNGIWLATAGSEEIVRLWNARSGDFERALPCPGASSVAFSPDGKMLACGYENHSGYAHGGGIVVWSTVTWKTVWNKKTTGRATVVYSPDGKTLAACTSGDKTHVEQRDSRTGKLIRNAYAKGLAGDTLAFLPDGKTLVVGTYPVDSGDQFGLVYTPGGARRYFDNQPDYDLVFLNASPSHNPLVPGRIHGQRPYGQLEGEAIDCLAVSPDGKIIATGHGTDHFALKLWSVAKRRYLRTLYRSDTGYHEVRSVVFSPDGKFVACPGVPCSPKSTFADDVAIWDVASGKLVRRLTNRGGVGTPLAFARDNRTLYIGAVEAWDVVTGKNLRMGGAEVGDCSQVVWSPDGKTWAGIFKGNVAIWDAAQNRLRRILPGGKEPISTIAISPDSETVAIGAAWEGMGEVRLYGLRDGRKLYTIETGGWSIGLAWSRSTGNLIIADGSGGAQIWNPATGKQEKEFKIFQSTGADFIRGMALTPDGSTLALAGSDDMGERRALEIWDISATPTLKRHAETNARKKTKPDEAYLNVEAMDFSPDGATLAIADITQNITLLETVSGRMIRQWKAPGGLSFSMCFSPDGKDLLTGHSEGHLALWDAATGKQLWVARGLMQGNRQGHETCVFSVAFAPGGENVLSAGGDGMAKQWDAHDGKLQATMLISFPWLITYQPPDWLAYTPQGYYTGARGIEEFIRWRWQNRLWPGDKFQTRFHQSGLVSTNSPQRTSMERGLPARMFVHKYDDKIIVGRI